MKKVAANLHELGEDFVGRALHLLLELAVELLLQLLLGERELDFLLLIFLEDENLRTRKKVFTKPVVRRTWVRIPARQNLYSSDKEASFIQYKKVKVALNPGSAKLQLQC